MKKKAVSALLCAAMVAGMLAGCGKGSDSGTPSDTSKGDASNATESCLLYTSPSPRDTR